MPETVSFGDDILKLIFNATAIPNIADDAVATPATQYYISLHKADPGESGDQTSGEIVYAGYARVAVPRTTVGWTILNGTVSLAAAVQFPPPTALTDKSASYCGIGTVLTGAGRLLYRIPLAPEITFIIGQPPRIDNLPPPSKLSGDWD